MKKVPSSLPRSREAGEVQLGSRIMPYSGGLEAVCPDVSQPVLSLACVTSGTHIVLQGTSIKTLSTLSPCEGEMIA